MNTGVPSTIGTVGNGLGLGNTVGTVGGTVGGPLGLGGLGFRSDNTQKVNPPGSNGYLSEPLMDLTQD